MGTHASVPTAVSHPLIPLSWTNISAGAYHTCGATTTGTVACWGRNDQGQLGDGTTNDSDIPVSLPVPVPGFVVAVAAGVLHSCALNGLGAAYCWGYNGNGELGDNSFIQRFNPSPVFGSLTFQSLWAGDRHTCGVTTGGNTYCWGANWDGQVGDNSRTARTTPTLVSGPAMQSVAPGADHTCGIGGATPYCWGENKFAQLGLGTKTPDEITPQAVATALGFTQLTAGQWFSCGITTGGSAYCWGDNSDGQLGLGYRSIEERPVKVAGGLVLKAPREVTATPPRGAKERGRTPRQ
jgi:alpha-tubulin suppressor-like RCC1 family protein